MPSTSDKQRRFMGAVLSYKLGHYKGGDVTDSVKKAADSMSVKQIKDYLEESINSLISEKSEYHKKYGRSKLFNITAMQELLATNSFLNNVYEKMKVRGKEIFGYHYNEIILSFIFLKYIKSNKELFKRYLTFKHSATAESEKETQRQNAIQQGAEIALKNTQQPQQEKEIDESSTSFGTFGTGGMPSTPNFLAKNKQNWGGGTKPVGYEGTKIIKNKLENPKTYTVQSKMNENFDELLNGELLINKLLNESTQLTPSNIEIETINGIDSLQYIKKMKSDFPDENLEIKFIIDTPESDGQTKIINVDFDEFLSYVRENWFKNEKIDDETLETEVTYNMFQYYVLDNMDKVSQTVDETHSKDVEPELKEHHIESRENITTFILSKTDKYTEQQLDGMDYDSLYKVYLDIESQNFPNTEKETEPNLIVGQENMEEEQKTIKQKIDDLKHIIKKEASKEKPDIELLKKLRADMEELEKQSNNKSMDENNKKLRSVKVNFENGDYINTSMASHLTDEDIYKYYKVGRTFNVGSGDKDVLTKVKSVEILDKEGIDESYDFDKILEKINEESQHPAITNLNRIKSENEKEETNYFKSLNKGIQDGIKDTENGAKFEYEYDDLPKGDENMDEDKRTKEEVADGVKYKNSDAVEDFLKYNKGRDAYDLDFDIEPSKKWLENLKKNIGEERYDVMMKKIKQRKLEKRYQRDVETEINPDRTKEKIDLTPNLPKMNELKEMFLMGKYKTVFNETLFKRLDVSKATEIETINENLTEFMVKGLGNTKSAKQVDDENGIKTYEVLKEKAEVIEKYKFYIDPKTLELFKVKSKIM
jgi:hypothetical protein